MGRILSIVTAPFWPVMWVINSVPFICFIVVMFLAFPAFLIPVANPSNTLIREYQMRDDGSVWSRRVWRTCENTTKWLDLSKLVRHPDEGDLDWFMYRNVWSIKSYMWRGMMLFHCDLWEFWNTQIMWQVVGHEDRMRVDWKKVLEKMDDQNYLTWQNMRNDIKALPGFIFRGTSGALNVWWKVFFGTPSPLSWEWWNLSNQKEL